MTTATIPRLSAITTVHKPPHWVRVHPQALMDVALQGPQAVSVYAKLLDVFSGLQKMAGATRAETLDLLVRVTGYARPSLRRALNALVRLGVCCQGERPLDGGAFQPRSDGQHWGFAGPDYPYERCSPIPPGSPAAAERSAHDRTATENAASLPEESPSSGEALEDSPAPREAAVPFERTEKSISPGTPGAPRARDWSTSRDPEQQATREQQLTTVQRLQQMLARRKRRGVELAALRRALRRRLSGRATEQLINNGSRAELAAAAGFPVRVAEAAARSWAGVPGASFHAVLNALCSIRERLRFHGLDFQFRGRPARAGATSAQGPREVAPGEHWLAYMRHGAVDPTLHNTGTHSPLGALCDDDRIRAHWVTPRAVAGAPTDEEIPY